MKVLIADDHPLVRAACLAQEPVPGYRGHDCLGGAGQARRTQASLVFRELEIQDSDQLALD